MILFLLLHFPSLFFSSFFLSPFYVRFIANVVVASFLLVLCFFFFFFFYCHCTCTFVQCSALGPCPCAAPRPPIRQLLAMAVADALDGCCDAMRRVAMRCGGHWHIKRWPNTCWLYVGGPRHAHLTPTYHARRHTKHTHTHTHTIETHYAAYVACTVEHCETGWVNLNGKAYKLVQFLIILHFIEQLLKLWEGLSWMSMRLLEALNKRRQGNN